MRTPGALVFLGLHSLQPQSKNWATGPKANQHPVKVTASKHEHKEATFARYKCRFIFLPFIHSMKEVENC